MTVQAFASVSFTPQTGFVVQQGTFPAAGQPAGAAAPALPAGTDVFQQGGQNAAVAGGADTFQAQAGQAQTAGAPAPAPAADPNQAQTAQTADGVTAAQQGGDAQANNLLQGLGKLIQQLGDIFKTIGDLLTGGGGGAQPADPGPANPTNPANPNTTNPNPTNPNPTPQVPTDPAKPQPGSVQHAMEVDMPAKIAANPKLAKDINAPINFNITGPGGGTWGLDLRKTSDWVQKGPIANPKATISISADDFTKLRNGTLDGMAAFQQGRIKFEPFDMGIAMKLGDLLK